jgi:hypothetical protein
MKVFIGFLCGLIVGGLFLFGASIVVPAMADDPSEADGGLAALVPDIETIYRQALLMPFEKARGKIYDPDIAEYYSELLDRAGLKNESYGAP